MIYWQFGVDSPDGLKKVLKSKDEILNEEKPSKPGYGLGPIFTCTRVYLVEKGHTSFNSQQSFLLPWNEIFNPM